MPKPVCSTCSVEMGSSRTGVLVVYCAIVVNQEPYEVYSADEHRCPNCGAATISRFGNEPIWQRHRKEKLPNIDGAVYVYERDRDFVRLADGKWAFWDETGAESMPFDTYAEAKKGRWVYAEQLNQEKPVGP